MAASLWNTIKGQLMLDASHSRSMISPTKVSKIVEQNAPQPAAKHLKCPSRELVGIATRF